MADGQAAPQLANLHLDEPTGEMVRQVSYRTISDPLLNACSKSELKKRQKQRELEEKKKAKAAAAPPKIEKNPTSAEQQEADLTPNVRGRQIETQARGTSDTDI